MRKRTISHISKTVCWGIVAWLPILGYLATILGHGDNVPILTYLADYTVNAANPIYTMLQGFFGNGVDSVMPLFGNANADAFLAVFAWYMSVYLVRLACEFVLFLPKTILKLIEGFTNDEKW